MTDQATMRPGEELDPAQGGGPPDALPWTLIVEGENWSADLEHGAPLPCVNDRIEYIGEDGARRTFRVTEIVHTLQSSASGRPHVEDERTGPNTLVTDGPADDPPRILRAGLPRVYAKPES